MTPSNLRYHCRWYIVISFYLYSHKYLPITEPSSIVPKLAHHLVLELDSLTRIVTN